MEDDLLTEIGRETVLPVDSLSAEDLYTEQAAVQELLTSPARAV